MGKEGDWYDKNVDLKNKHIFITASIFVLLVIPVTVYAADQIPSWVRVLATWWEKGLISDEEFNNAIEYLAKKRIIQSKENLQTLVKNCSGNARCFVGTVTQVIDGDTIKVDGKSIRFSLVNTPEYGEYGYVEARQFIERICQVGSLATVDEDDLQTEGSYGRIIAVIYCNGVNLNESVLKQGHATIYSSFCSKSEFSSKSWAQKYGCGPKTQEVKPSKQSSCDPSYPTVCIPSPPPDLDCGEIEFRNFKVLPPDPHRFDGDKDGIGCES